ncbi:hypothetical protein D3C84_712080 [compost metagenome]
MLLRVHQPDHEVRPARRVRFRGLCRGQQRQRGADVAGQPGADVLRLCRVFHFRGAGRSVPYFRVQPVAIPEIHQG